MTELDEAFNGIIFEEFLKHCERPSSKLRIIRHVEPSVHEPQYLMRYQARRHLVNRPPTFREGAVIWRFHKKGKNFIWGSMRISEIKDERIRLYINAIGWGIARKLFFLGDPNFFNSIEEWFGEFCAKKPKKRWRE